MLFQIRTFSRNRTEHAKCFSLNVHVHIDKNWHLFQKNWFHLEATPISFRTVSQSSPASVSLLVVSALWRPWLCFKCSVLQRLAAASGTGLATWWLPCDLTGLAQAALGHSPETRRTHLPGSLLPLAISTPISHAHQVPLFLQVCGWSPDTGTCHQGGQRGVCFPGNFPCQPSSVQQQCGKLCGPIPTCETSFAFWTEPCRSPSIYCWVWLAHTLLRSFHLSKNGL